MNIFKGKITAVKSHEGLSLVEATSGGGNTFTTVVIDTPGTAAYLAAGSTVNILFKETEVMLSRTQLPGLSVRNQVAGTILKIMEGEILCQLTIRNGETIFRSIITSRAQDQLSFKEGESVYALVKSTEVTLSPDV